MRAFLRLTVLLFLLSTIPGLDARPQPVAPDLHSIVNISGENMSVSQVLRSIRKQTGLSFFYSNQLLNDKEKVSLHFRKARLDEVLDYLFKGRNIGYELRGNRVLLNEKPTPAKVAAESPTTQKTKDTVDVKGQV